MIHFDATREGNRVPIRKVFDEADKHLGTKSGGSDSCQREFFIQGKQRGHLSRGVGSAGDVEMMFMKSRKPVASIKKKARISYDGDTCQSFTPKFGTDPLWPN